MDFQLPEELAILKQTVRRFVDTEMIPLEGRSLEGGKIKPDLKADLDEKAKALGLWLIDVPEEFGGQGLGLLARSVVWEELGRSVALPTRGVSVTGPDVRPILYALDDARGPVDREIFRRALTYYQIRAGATGSPEHSD